jgi:rod shape-determining protein MreC
VSAENKRLRSLAGFRDNFKLGTTAALVIGRSPTSWQSVATINLGSQDGIRARTAVVTDKGLVGQVVTLTKGTAIVQMVDDRRSGVAVELARTGATGIVEGRLNGTLQLRFIAGDADIKQGDLVVTSGTGGVYPRGIKVGVVKEISDTAYSLEREILLRPAVVYRKLSEVLVVTDRPGE